MALRPLLLASLVGIAALGAFHVPTAQARGSLSVTIGTPSPYYRDGYNRGYVNDYNRGYDRRFDRRVDRRHQRDHRRAQQVWVPGHWHRSQRGRVWVPGQYERARGYTNNRRDGRGTRVIYRSTSTRVTPRSYYPAGYLSPFEQRRRRGW